MRPKNIQCFVLYEHGMYVKKHLNMFSYWVPKCIWYHTFRELATFIGRTDVRQSAFADNVDDFRKILTWIDTQPRDLCNECVGIHVNRYTIGKASYFSSTITPS